MFEKLGSLIKDAAADLFSAGAGFILTKILNGYLGDIGVLKNISISKAQKNISGSILLKGESEPTNFSIQKYSLRKSDGLFVKAETVETSKEWLNPILKKFVAGKEFKVPVEVPEKYLKFFDG